MKRYEIKQINSALWLAASPPFTVLTKGVKRSAVGTPRQQERERDIKRTGGTDTEETSFSCRQMHRGRGGRYGGGAFKVLKHLKFISNNSS